MDKPTAQHQLGQFIVYFQYLEGAVNAMIAMLSKADGDAVDIMINRLSNADRIDAADVLFSRYVRLFVPDKAKTAGDFHKLCETLLEIGKRRNELVHSSYAHWTDILGERGLLRQGAKLKSAKGILEEKEEELQAQHFEQDLDKLTRALRDLERFRLTVLDWEFGPS